MKRLLFAFFIMFPLLTFASLAYKPLECFSTESLLLTIQNDFQESLVFHLNNMVTKNKSSIMMFKNKKTGTWTLIEIFNENSCVLAAGQDNDI